MIGDSCLIPLKIGALYKSENVFFAPIHAILPQFHSLLLLVDWVHVNTSVHTQVHKSFSRNPRPVWPVVTRFWLRKLEVKIPPGTCNVD